MTTLRALLGDKTQMLTRYQCWALAFGVLRGLAMACLMWLTPALLARDWTAVRWWLLATAVITVASLVAHYCQAMAVFEMSLTIQDDLQKRIGDKVVELPIGWFTGARAAELSVLTTKGVSEVGQAAGHFLTPIIAGMSSSMVVAIATWLLDWRMGLTLTAFVPLLWACHHWTLGLADGTEAAKHAASASTSGRILEFARSQSLLRASGRSLSYAPLEDAIEHVRVVGRRHLWREVSAVFLSGAVVQAAVGAGLAVAVSAASGGGLDAGRALGAIALCIIAAQPLMLAFENGAGFRHAMIQARRITTILETPSLPQPDEPAVVSRPGLVEVDHVSFGYEPGRRVLHDVTFSVAPRSMTAVIGPSGCGKTTLTTLIARFRDVDAGAVRVGGVDVRELTTPDLMAQLALVFQDVYLFDDTLRANVALGAPNATDAEVEEAARLAGVTEILRRLPQGWQTPVGEGGSRLSGGERQRVSIARALLKRPPIVLLDEATAALDPENERQVTEAMDALANTTRVVIAHKRDTIRAADQVVVLTAEGRVNDVGTHEELVERCAQYRDFWADREQASGWELVAAE